MSPDDHISQVVQMSPSLRSIWLRRRDSELTVSVPNEDGVHRPEKKRCSCAWLVNGDDANPSQEQRPDTTLNDYGIRAALRPKLHGRVQRLHFSPPKLLNNFNWTATQCLTSSSQYQILLVSDRLPRRWKLTINVIHIKIWLTLTLLHTWYLVHVYRHERSSMWVWVGGTHQWIPRVVSIYMQLFSYQTISECGYWGVKLIM